MSQVERDPFPKPRRRRPTPKQDLEGAVLKEIKAWLKTCPQVLYFERRNTGAVAFDDGSRVSFGSEGAADVWALVKKEFWYPVHVEIEVKRRDGKGRMSPAQEAFAAEMKRNNVFYVCVTCVGQLEDYFRENHFIP